MSQGQGKDRDHLSELPQSFIKRSCDVRHIRAYKPELRFREYDIYHGCYCGLCEALHRRHGTAARWSCYDMTFLILLLTVCMNRRNQDGTTLYCTPVSQESAHTKRRDRLCRRYEHSAVADKCMDDWNDERKISRRAAAGMSSRSYRKIQQQYPEKCSVVRTQLEKLHEMEQNHESNPEIPAGCFGTMLGELFVWKDDIWADTLRQVGFYLGKFIYLLDAYDDLEHDRKKQCYNPFHQTDTTEPQFSQNCEALLQMMMSSCAAAFERLPILHYEEILRNILYAGVWTKFYQKKKEQEK
ncbi:MAG: DUF5685 family protein [Ruminococcus callidus]